MRSRVTSLLERSHVGLGPAGLRAGLSASDVARFSSAGLASARSHAVSRRRAALAAASARWDSSWSYWSSARSSHSWLG